MIEVRVSKQSNYPVSLPKLKRTLKKFLKEQGIVSDSVVDVTIVGEAKMLEVGRKFLKDRKLHNVLSFTEAETKGEFVFPPGGKIYLGEIIICYPKVLEEAKLENKLIDEKVAELAKHGALHLLGVHHKE